MRERRTWQQAATASEKARVIPVHWPGQGLRVGRRLLLDINGLGLPCGCEFLDTISPQARSPAAPVLHKSL